MLNNLKMNVVQTAKNGVVTSETIFHFEQHGNFVSANYSGGQIKQGHLVGSLVDSILSFGYCQFRIDGTIDYGTSHCVLSIVNGKIQLEETFEMTTEETTEKGINIFKEI